MAEKWIDEQEGYDEGNEGFLIRFSNENAGSERFTLRDTPAHTNQSNKPRLHGWCGSYNNVSTSAEGAWVVIRKAKNGRTLIRELDEGELQLFLEAMGYPDLTAED